MWIVEIDYGGINWQPICYCVSENQAEEVAGRPHILAVGKPVRVRKYGTPAPLPPDRFGLGQSPPRSNL